MSGARRNIAQSLAAGSTMQFAGVKEAEVEMRLKQQQLGIPAPSLHCAGPDRDQS